MATCRGRRALLRTKILQLMVPHMLQEGVEGFVIFVFEVSGDAGQASQARLERLRE